MLERWPYYNKKQILNLYDETESPEARIDKARRIGAPELWLGNLGMSTLPESIGQLSQLRELYLHSNKLAALPECIGHLSQLRGLYLDDNALSTLPESVGQLSQLRVLSLYNNRLKALPESLQSLRHLERLDLRGNKALGLPVEVLEPSREEPSVTPANPAEILEYYFRTRGEERPLNEAKLILLGRGAVGKTSIVNRLVHDKFEEVRKTEGIEITGWALKVGERQEDVRLHVWDFGGQEIMHATHQFFLTERSLYLLVLSGREGFEDAEAEYWLKLIQSFGGEDPPVVVVLNKIGEYPFDVNRSALRSNYPFIRDFVKTDCKDEIGIEELRRAVERETDKLEHLRDSFPARWFSIKNTLAKMTRNYLSYDEYRKVCERHGESDEKGQESLAIYLHNLGIALNYKDDKRLEDTHVLNPHWVTGGIYKVLNAARLERQNGEIALSDLSGLLDGREYPPEMYCFLLGLMKRFELCFSLEGREGVYLIPELLCKQEPDEARAFNPAKCLNFQYHYPVLLEGLLPRFIVRTHVLSDETRRWRTGVILRLEDALALVRADAQERRIVINIDGPVAEKRRRLLSIIRANFDRIHDSIRNLKPKEMVPLPQQPNVCISYAKLLAFVASGDPNMREFVDGRIIPVNAPRLLGVVEAEVERPRPPGPRPAADADLARAARVFVSYSHKDERLLNELKVQLSPLRRMRLIETWHDREIEAGDDWRERIGDNLEHADLVIILVSANFLASDYCFEKEFSRALDRHAKNEARIVPVIVRDSGWRKIPQLARLQAIPKDGKAVMSWTNRDRAWLDVFESIQKLLEGMNAADQFRRGAR